MRQAHHRRRSGGNSGVWPSAKRVVRRDSLSADDSYVLCGIPERPIQVLVRLLLRVGCSVPQARIVIFAMLPQDVVSLNRPYKLQSILCLSLPLRECNLIRKGRCATSQRVPSNDSLPATPTDKDLNVAYREINSKRRRSSSEQIKSRTGGFDYIQLSANADINTGSTPDHFAAWTPNKTVVRLSKIMLSKKITR